MNIIVRLAYLILNSLAFYLTAIYIPLAELGLLTVAITMAGFIFAVIDLGQTQIGSTALARLIAKKNKSSDKYLTWSVNFKIKFIGIIFVLSLFGIFLSTEIDGVNEKIEIFSIVWLSTIAQVICAPWMAIALNNIKMYALILCFPKILFLISVLLIDSLHQVTSAEHVAIIMTTTSVLSSIIFYKFYIKKIFEIKLNYSKININEIKRGFKKMNNSYVTLASMTYSPVMLLLASHLGGNIQVGVYTVADKICRTSLDLLMLKYQFDIAKMIKSKKDNFGTITFQRNSLIYGISFSLSMVLLLLIFADNVLLKIFSEEKAIPIIESLYKLLPLIAIVTFSGWLLYFKLILKNEYENALVPYLVGGASGLLFYYLSGIYYVYTIEFSVLFAESVVLILLLLLQGRNNVKL